MTVGENIKRFRLEKGMTQKQLGDKCGIADSAIRRYELGGANPKIETLIKIADALDVDVYELNPERLNKILEEEIPLLQHNAKIRIMLSMLEAAGYKIIQTPCFFNDGDWKSALSDDGIRIAINDKSHTAISACKNYRGKQIFCNDCQNFLYKDYIIQKNGVQITVTKEEMETHINDIIKYVNFIFSET